MRVYLMEITFLGTGAGMPSKERNVSSLVLNLLQEINQLWLFDCGEATQHQILHTTLKPRKISKVFITHLHGDHIFGLPGLLSSRSFLGGDEALTIYGPTGIKKYVELSLKISQSHLTYPLKFVEITKEDVIFENDQFIVHTCFLNHNIMSIGYRITEKDKLGELNVEKLMKLGIKPGPIYRQIKENEQTVLDNGVTINRKDVTGETKKGKIISIFGDTRFIAKHSDFISKSDVLIHEATFDATKKDLAREYYHSTTEEAALLAKKGEVKTLILTHISSRYQGEARLALLNEARTIFPNTILARDLFTFNI